MSQAQLLKPYRQAKALTLMEFAQDSVRARFHPELSALFDPVPPPPRIRLRTHWRLRIAFHVIGRRASNPRSKRHELGLYRVSDIASFLLPGE